MLSSMLQALDEAATSAFSRALGVSPAIEKYLTVAPVTGYENLGRATVSAGGSVGAAVAAGIGVAVGRGVGVAVGCGVRVASGILIVGAAALGVTLSDASESPVERVFPSEMSAISSFGLSAGLSGAAVVRPKTTEPPRPAKTRAITSKMPTQPRFREAGAVESTKGVLARQL